MSKPNIFSIILNQVNLCRLFDICTNRTSLIFDKVVYKLDSTPTILTLNSKDVKNQPYLYCHLELHLPSDRYGVQIFIEVVKHEIKFQQYEQIEIFFFRK